MIDPQLLREQPDLVKASQERRGDPVGLVDDALAAESARRAAITEFERLRAEQNAHGKLVGAAAKDERPALIEQGRALAAGVKDAQARATEAEAAFDAAVSKLGNIVHPDVPAGEENNLYANCYDSSAAQVYSKVLVDWIINDSAGAANALVVNLPAFPILSAQAEGASAAFETCTGCTVKSLDLTLDDVVADEANVDADAFPDVWTVGPAELRHGVEQAPLGLDREGRLEGGDARGLEADRRGRDALVRTPFRREGDARGGADEDRAPAGVRPEHPRLERAADERVVDRPDRQQRLAELGPGRTQLAEQAHEVDLGDAELEVLPPALDAAVERTAGRRGPRPAARAFRCVTWRMYVEARAVRRPRSQARTNYLKFWGCSSGA